MKQLVFIEDSYAEILERVESEGISLYNLPHTCLANHTPATQNICEVIRDSLTGNIVHSGEIFSVIMHVTTKEGAFVGFRRYTACLPGTEIAHWAMTNFTDEIGTFAIILHHQDDIIPKASVFTTF